MSNESFTPGPPGCLTITVTSSSSPNLGQLTGTIFATQRADWISLQFNGALSYVNAGTAIAGDLRSTPNGAGPLQSLTGQVTIPGAQGSNATVSVRLIRLLGWYVGTIRVTDPSAHLDQTTPIFTQTVSRIGDNGAQGSSNWFTFQNHKLANYTLGWVIVDADALP